MSLTIDFMILAKELHTLLFSDKSVAVLDVRTVEEYNDGHIYQAISSPEIFTYLPKGMTTDKEKKDFIEFYENLFCKAGISKDTIVVLYEDKFTLKSPRGLSILKYLGHKEENIKVLDGGYESWCNNSFATSRDARHNKASKFTVNIDKDFFVDYDEMLQIIYDKNIITLDVRDEDEWIGISSSPYGIDYAPKKGRLPNAVWIEWYEFITHDMMSVGSLSKIKLALEQKNIHQKDQIVLYCFKGARLSNSYIALRKLGYENIRIYFAGWNEWCRKDDAPIINEVNSSDDPLLKENIALKEKLSALTLKENSLIDFPKYNLEPIFAFDRDGNICFENKPKQKRLPSIKKFTDIFKDATSIDIFNIIDNGEKRTITLEEEDKYYSLNCVGSRDSNQILVYAFEITELNNLNLLLKNTINSAENIIFVKDREFKYIECNRAFEKFIGYPKEELLGKDDYNFFDKELADFFRAKDTEMFVSKKRVENRQWTTFSDGSKVYLYTVVTPLYNDVGEIVGLVGNAVDLTNQKRLENTLKEQKNTLNHQAHHDVLTGLKNRLNLEHDIQVAIDTYQEYKAPYGALMFDIDWFKSVNDIYGHDVGDRVLIELSDILVSSVRQEDKVYRAGGEEFVILLKRISYKDIVKVAEKIRLVIEKHVFKVEDKEFSKTISGGLFHSSSCNAFDVKSVLKLIDNALYDSKASGRNRITIASQRESIIEKNIKIPHIEIKFSDKTLSHVLSVVNDTIDSLCCNPKKLLSQRNLFIEMIHPVDFDILINIPSDRTKDKPYITTIRMLTANEGISIYRVTAYEENAQFILLLEESVNIANNVSDSTHIKNLHSMLENTNDYIYFKDRNHVFTGASKTLVSVTSVNSREELIGKIDYDVFDKELADEYFSLERKVFDGELEVAQEIQPTVDNEGNKGYVDNRKYPIHDEAGNIIGLFGIARIVTNAKTADDEIFPKRLL